MDPRAGSEGDPECIFFTPDTYQATFIRDILLYYCRNLSCFPDTRTADGRTDGGSGGRTDRRGSRNSYLDRIVFGELLMLYKNPHLKALNLWQARVTTFTQQNRSIC